MDVVVGGSESIHVFQYLYRLLVTCQVTYLSPGVDKGPDRLSVTCQVTLPCLSAGPRSRPISELGETLAA